MASNEQKQTPSADDGDAKSNSDSKEGMDDIEYKGSLDEQKDQMESVDKDAAKQNASEESPNTGNEEEARKNTDDGKKENLEVASEKNVTNEDRNQTEIVQETCADPSALTQQTEKDSKTIIDSEKGTDMSVDSVVETSSHTEINDMKNIPKESVADKTEDVSGTGDVKDTNSEIESSSVLESAKDVNGSINIGGDLMNMSTRATCGDSSCDNLSVSAVSETKSGGFERRFSVDRMETDDADMNTLKEERLEQYLESMKSVNQDDGNVEEANDGEGKLESAENLISEAAVKETVAGKSEDNSDRSTESSNGEKSQTDMEVAQIMQKGVARKKDTETEQHENTSIPDVDIETKDGKDVWKTDIEMKEKSEQKEVTGSFITDKLEDKTDKEVNESDKSKEAEKDTVVYPEKETDFAFVKLPVSNKTKKDTEQPREILKRKMFDEFAEDSSNSSWYKIKDKPTEEAMDTDDKSNKLLVPDEESNLSIPDDSSLASASGMEDSRLSFTDQVSNMDEFSNLSAADSCSVKAFGHELVLDESANLNPPDKDLFVQPSTPSSVVTDATSEATPVKRYRKGTLAAAVEEASSHGHNIKAKDLFEYQWPQESGGDWFMLQEQISTYLEVKSFKRKYPDLFRRVCDKSEKDFLREKGVVSETQSDLGLTALKSEEVHELISKDYPSKYREYCTVLHEKEKQIMVSKQKDYVLPKLEKSKMREYTMKAMKSASEWNRQFLKERNEERRAYFDMQTFAIHYPKNKFRKLENIKSAPTSYPVSLIPGQFQEYCRKYTSEELKYFPLNTAMLDPPKDLVPGTQDLLAAGNQEKEADKARTASDSESDSESGESDCEDQAKGDVGQKFQESFTSREESAEKQAEPAPVDDLSLCWVCVEEEKQGKPKKKRKNSKTDEEFISCSECKKRGHASCLDLTDAMLKVIKTYPWQCMECKTCVECMNSTDEDKMLFCDHCDRGYHTFCVGLKSLPTGKWECVSCRGDANITPVKPGPKPQVKPVSTLKRRGRPPKNPNPEVAAR